MKGSAELVMFRLEKADQSLDIAKVSVEKGYWNKVANELYYTSFYLVLALFAKFDIQTSTHSGVNTVFGLKFIKKGELDAKWGRLHSSLFSKRQEGVYGDLVYLKEEEILPLLKEVEEFRTVIKGLLQY